MPTVKTTESLITVLGVVYLHKKSADGGDLYLTRYGVRHADLLETENWYEEDWFREHRQRLEGTSAVYRVPTRYVDGKCLDLVVKNCRVGEHIPVETRALLEFINAEFNSPWEEFALVMEMREGRHGPPEMQIHTQEPLAIYVPPERMQIWQSGRSQAKINRIRARHPAIDLDILRQYKLVYGWIHGEDVVNLLSGIGLRGDELKERVEPLTKKAIADMNAKGFTVVDMKPAHIIIGEDNTQAVEEIESSHHPDARKHQVECIEGLVQDGDYSIIDYELLIRTPEHEKRVQDSRRQFYLHAERDRFITRPLPAHLKQVKIFDVPYVFGHAESTGGKLWVVGKNGELFDYFLPERWRKTHSWKLSENNEVYYTFTKDHVHVVWKTSRVGEDPPVRLRDAREEVEKSHGFNSPFEEFSIAQDLSKNGVPTVYVRAIYMTGSLKSEPSPDRSRFESHRDLLDPDGHPALRDDRNYITLRGFYNGPDSWVAQRKGKLYRPVDLPKALSNAVVTESQYRKVFDSMLCNLRNIGYDGSLLKGNDLLLALDADGNAVKDSHGLPEARISNFERIWKT